MIRSPFKLCPFNFEQNINSKCAPNVLSGQFTSKRVQNGVTPISSIEINSVMLSRLQINYLQLTSFQGLESKLVEGENNPATASK